MFRRGNFDLNDLERSGKPQVDNDDDQIEINISNMFSGYHKAAARYLKHYDMQIYTILLRLTI